MHKSNETKYRVYYNGEFKHQNTQRYYLLARRAVWRGLPDVLQTVSQLSSRTCFGISNVAKLLKLIDSEINSE